jgi:hypothetical protein
MLTTGLAVGAISQESSAGGGQRGLWQRYLQLKANAEPALNFPYENCFRQAAGTYSVPLTLLLAVARGESDFEPTARSRANAHGLMQIQWPGTARHLGIQRLSDLHDPCTNVDAGARYLAELLGRYRGDLHLALAAYNYGPGRIDVGATRIPDGADWYSRYVYSHLGYVLGTGTGSGAPRPYRGESKLDVIVFNRPYRAEAFVERLRKRAPAVRLDWFRREQAAFAVVLLYRDRDELSGARRALKRAGFALPTR